MRCRAQVAVVCSGLIALAMFAGPASAAQHRLKELHNDSVDLVVSLDFEATDTNKSQLLDETWRALATSFYQVSDGQAQICRLYIYEKGRYRRNADIILYDRPGRAHSVGSAQVKDGHVHAYTKYAPRMGEAEGAARAPLDLGTTLTHELSHYLLSIKDEYGDERLNSQAPGAPQAMDFTHPTMMGDWLNGPFRYSVAADYVTEASRRTAQFRIWGMDAWSLIATPVNRSRLSAKLADPRPRWVFEPHVLRQPRPRQSTDLTMPTLNLETSCFEPLYMEGHFAVIVIDNSNSMDEPRLDAAKQVAKSFVNSMADGDHVMLATMGPPFVSSARTRLDTPQDRLAVNNIIDGLQAVGDSGYNDPLVFAAAELEANPQANFSYVVLLGDGEVTDTDKGAKAMLEHGFPVYGAHFGLYGKRQIVDLTKVTEGRFYGGAEVGTMYADITARVQQADVTDESSNFEPTVGTPTENEILVSEVDQEMSFEAYWVDGSPYLFELVSPSSDVISPTNLPPGATWEGGPGGGRFQIVDPEVGTWISRVSTSIPVAGTELVQYASSSGLLDVQLDIKGSYPEPTLLRAAVANGSPVLGATVIAEVTEAVGGAAIATLTLVDDGTNADQAPSDGVYTGVLANELATGDYLVTVIASNPDGMAIIEPGAAALEPEATAEPLSLSPFLRLAREEIFNEIVPMPLSKSSARAVKMNGLHLEWGAFEKPGDALWFSFMPVTDIDVYLQTAMFWATDGGEIATRLTLYDTDGVTELAASEREEDTPMSFMRWRAPSSGPYYAKVEHVDGGRGRFAFFVGYSDRFHAPSLPTASPPGAGASSDDDGCGCSVPGGNHARWPTSLWVLLWLGVRRRRR